MDGFALSIRLLTFSVDKSDNQTGKHLLCEEKTEKNSTLYHCTDKVFIHSMPQNKDESLLLVNKIFVNLYLGLGKTFNKFPSDWITWILK